MLQRRITTGAYKEDTTIVMNTGDTEQLYETVRFLYSIGYSQTEIAIMVNRTQGRVSQILNGSI